MILLIVKLNDRGIKLPDSLLSGVTGQVGPGKANNSAFQASSAAQTTEAHTTWSCLGAHFFREAKEPVFRLRELYLTSSPKGLGLRSRHTLNQNRLLIGDGGTLHQQNPQNHSQIKALGTTYPWAERHGFWPRSFPQLQTSTCVQLPWLPYKLPSTLGLRKHSTNLEYHSLRDRKSSTIHLTISAATESNTLTHSGD